jgi:hypothetical protein
MTTRKINNSYVNNTVQNRIQDDSHNAYAIPVQTGEGLMGLKAGAAPVLPNIFGGKSDYTGDIVKGLQSLAGSVVNGLSNSLFHHAQKSLNFVPENTTAVPSRNGTAIGDQFNFNKNFNFHQDSNGDPSQPQGYLIVDKNGLHSVSFDDAEKLGPGWEKYFEGTISHIYPITHMGKTAPGIRPDQFLSHVSEFSGKSPLGGDWQVVDDLTEMYGRHDGIMRETKKVLDEMNQLKLEGRENTPDYDALNHKFFESRLKELKAIYNVNFPSQFGDMLFREYFKENNPKLEDREIEEKIKNLSTQERFNTFQG